MQCGVAESPNKGTLALDGGVLCYGSVALSNRDHCTQKAKKEE